MIAGRSFCTMGSKRWHGGHSYLRQPLARFHDLEVVVRPDMKNIQHLLEHFCVLTRRHHHRRKAIILD
ncbi:hypothetical protein FD32_GL001380 [Limosilactobacillus panis DSM 6035]|uniref:Uncharacterized protein n=1 Tax=Limosilactobacillus panis DSM 6035 TaxID=1423782 RepID=A0A0R1XJE3_9LACO|nr:hypothetical protein FD32_GL001380 [Limosilactobacillus panis DSM 6035]